MEWNKHEDSLIKMQEMKNLVIKQRHEKSWIGVDILIKLWWKNKNHKRKLLFGLPIILSIALLTGTIYIPTLASEIDKAKSKVSNLEKKKLETENRISELEKDKNDILKYIEELDGESTRIEGEIDTLNSNITVVNNDLKTTKKKLKKAKATEADQYSTMKKRIKYMYENGNTSYLDIIMQSKDLSEILNQVEYTSKITEYDNNLLEEYKKVKQEVKKQEGIQETKLETLKDLKEELDYEKETVERLSAEKQAEIKKYNNSINEAQSLSSEYASEIDKQEERVEQLLEAERKRIEEEQRRKEEEERKKREANGSKEEEHHTVAGDFIWPVPSSGRITSDFGPRQSPTPGASTYHKGIDIGAPTGSNIVASKSGTVVIAGYSASTGNYIMISHGDGIFTTYMHCSKLLVSEGDEVNQGDVIGKVGSTGYSTGPHCHFAITVDGAYVNPLNYVSY